MYGNVVGLMMLGRRENKKEEKGRRRELACVVLAFDYPNDAACLMADGKLERSATRQWPLSSITGHVTLANRAEPSASPLASVPFNGPCLLPVFASEASSELVSAERASLDLHKQPSIFEAASVNCG